MPAFWLSRVGLNHIQRNSPIRQAQGEFFVFISLKVEGESDIMLQF